MKVDELRGEMEVDEAGRGEPYAFLILGMTPVYQV
jgi:hypothetical protein